ncbi:MAG: hypothetical protein ACREPX_04245, partial [Rhodanobacteraceae bacterium]
MESMTWLFAAARRVARRAGCVGVIALAMLYLPAADLGAATPASHRVRLEGHTLQNQLPLKSATSDAGPLTLTLVLRRDDEVGFQAFLHDVYDP